MMTGIGWIRAATAAVLAIAISIGVVGASAQPPTTGGGSDRPSKGSVRDIGSKAAARLCGDRRESATCRRSGYAFSSLISVRTLFGRMYFGDCTTAFDVVVGRESRLDFEHVVVGGRSPCNDIRPCAPKAAIRRSAVRNTPYPHVAALPWQGEVISSGRDSVEGWVEVCLDTCIGRYRGRLAVDLRRRQGAWRMVARNAGVGDGILEFDGEWDVDEPQPRGSGD